MSINSVVTDLNTRDLFGVLVRALISKSMVMSSKSDVTENYINEVLCTVQQVVAV
jgi:hypothetical protein